MLAYSSSPEEFSNGMEHYLRIVRRARHLAAPFDIDPITVAMHKALLAVKSTMWAVNGYPSALGALSSNLAAGFKEIRLQLRLISIGFAQILLKHAAMAALRRKVAQPPLGHSIGTGFFSAAKPDLRNAP